MAAKDCLWLFDYYSLVLGISIFIHERCKFLVYCNYVWRSIQMIISFVAAVCSFKIILTSSTPLYELTNGIFFAGHFIFRLLMYIQGVNICRQFNNAFTKIKDHQKRKICIVSSCSTSISILLHIWIIVVKGVMESISGYSWDTYIVVLSLQINGDLYIPTLTWVSLLTLSSYYECQNYLNDIEQRLQDYFFDVGQF